MISHYFRRIHELEAENRRLDAKLGIAINASTKWEMQYHHTKELLEAANGKIEQQIAWHVIQIEWLEPAGSGWTKCKIAEHTEQIAKLRKEIE